MPGTKNLSQHKDDINRIDQNKTEGGAYFLGYDNSSRYIGLNYNMKSEFNEYSLLLLLDFFTYLVKHIKQGSVTGGCYVSIEK